MHSVRITRHSETGGILEPQLSRSRHLGSFGARSGRFFPPTRSGEFCGLQREDAEAGPVRYTAP
jgi:hypothetical protein